MLGTSKGYQNNYPFSSYRSHISEQWFENKKGTLVAILTSFPKNYKRRTHQGIVISVLHDPNQPNYVTVSGDPEKRNVL